MSEAISVRPAGNLAEQLQYARALAAADLLPPAYRDKPANLLLALAFGESLNLNVSQILSSVNVIEGKPTMGAELMSALTRRAGHRIRVSGDEESATCSIWRADDPEFEYRAVWTISRAVQAGLCTLKDGRPYARSKYGKVLPWEAYPGALLRARAISECCRMGAADVLSGVSFVQEELEPQYIDATPEPAVPAQLAVKPAAVAKQRKADKASVAQHLDPPVVVDPDPGPSAPNPDVRGRLDDVDREMWRAQWLDQLDEAIQAQDFTAVTALGNSALGEGHTDLVDDARNAWSIIQGKAAAEQQHATAGPDQPELA